MKKNKVLIITLTVILVLLVIVAGFLFIYLQTDFLKTDKQLFFKYMGETAKNLDTYDSDKLNSYFEKLQTTPYESNGKLTVAVDIPDELKQGADLDKVNNLSLTFSGKTDNVNKKSEENLQLNYSDDVSFPVKLKRVNDIYGIESDIVLKQCVAVDTNKLEDLLNRLEVENAEDIISLFNEDDPLLTESQIQAELDRYKDVILSNITDTNFSKTQNGEGISLTLSEREAFTILTQIIYEASESQNLPNEITDYMSAVLEEIKEVDINELKADGEFIKVTVNKGGLVEIKIQDLIDIQMQFTDSTLTIIATVGETTVNAKISKIEDANQVGYNFELAIPVEGIEFTILFNSNYSDLSTQNVKENYILAFGLTTDDESISYEYTLDSSKKFTNSIDIKDFEKDNTVLLTDMDTARADALITVLPKQVQNVNSQLLQKMGLTDEQNPLIYASPIGFLVEMINQVPNINVTEQGDTPVESDDNDSVNVLENNILEEPSNNDINNNIMIGL